jgi:hypothetical protein
VRNDDEGGQVTETDKKELGRNDPCHCGSGKKYKACHLAQDEAAAREARAKEQAKQAEAEPAATDAAAAERPHDHEQRKPQHATTQPWKKSGQDARAVPRFNAPRRSGGS